MPGGPCSTDPSCTLAPARTITGEKSARRTAPYQTEASSSTVTSPTSVAVGATNARGCTLGAFPSSSKNGMPTSSIKVLRLLFAQEQRGGFGRASPRQGHPQGAVSVVVDDPGSVDVLYLEADLGPCRSQSDAVFEHLDILELGLDGRAALDDGSLLFGIRRGVPALDGAATEDDDLAVGMETGELGRHRPA